MNDINEVLKSILTKVLGNEQEALVYSEDPAGYLIDHGVADTDLSQLSIGDTINAVSNELNFAPEVSQTLIEMPTPARTTGYSGGGGGGGSASAPAAASAPVAAAAPPPPPPAPVTMETIQQTVNNYVTEVYQTNETINQNITDNSRHFNVDIEGEVHGDVEIIDESNNVTAAGDGAVAAGDDASGVATGDAAVAAGRDIEDSNIASGDGAVAFDGENSGVVNTGSNEGIISQGSADGAVVGDGNTVNNVDGDGNTIGDGNVAIGGDGVVGDGNATIQGSDDVTAGFGSGDTANFEGANIGGGDGDTQISFGGGSNATQDNDTTIDNSISDSFNDQSTNTNIVTDNSTNDSFNTEDSFNNEDSFNTEDSFNSSVETEIVDSFDTDNSINDSFQAEESFNTAVETDVSVEQSMDTDIISD